MGQLPQQLSHDLYHGLLQACYLKLCTYFKSLVTGVLSMEPLHGPTPYHMSRVPGKIRGAVGAILAVSLESLGQEREPEKLMDCPCSLQSTGLLQSSVHQLLSAPLLCFHLAILSL